VADMTPLDFLSQFPKHGEFSRKSKIVIFAYYLRRYRGVPEFLIADIRRCFTEAMLRPPCGLGALLKTLAKGRESPLIKTGGQKYSLSIHGLGDVEKILPIAPPSQVTRGSFLDVALPYLKRTISRVNDEARREFLAEAISCLGVEARRATIVMTWLAAIDHMHEYVITHKLQDFNAALKRRSDKWSTLKIAEHEDLEEIKESVFIEVCRSAKIITNDVRKILDEKLGTRHSCAHPSSIKIGDSKVVNFIEDLVDNVVAKYEI